MVVAWLSFLCGWAPTSWAHRRRQGS